jgi:hypothetical protein
MKAGVCLAAFCDLAPFISFSGFLQHAPGGAEAGRHFAGEREIHLKNGGNGRLLNR